MSPNGARDWQESVDDVVSGGSGRARSALGQLRGPETPRQFSPFVDDDLDRATALASQMMEIAEATPGPDGLSAALAEADGRMDGEVPGLVQYAVALFVTHFPPARDVTVFRPLEQRQPMLVMPSAAAGPGATPPEEALDYWREDPLLNEHHEHWHLVYPMRGRPGATLAIGDRHGELFAYMHQQMLARYDAERLSVDLPPVEPFADYRATIPQGYDPGPLRYWDGAAWTTFRARPAGATISDLAAPYTQRPGALVPRHEAFRDALFGAARTGRFQLPQGPPVPVRIDNLGDTAEANVRTVDPQQQTYGNHHNDGHIHFMRFDNTPPNGVMASTATAVRDPVFFRWHKQVDAVFRAFQDQQPPYDFAADAPPVRLLGIEVSDLATEMLVRDLPVEDESGARAEPIRYLSHDDFSYVFRAENPTGADQDVTVRVFLAPETECEDRTAWIEMDRFAWRVPAGEHIGEHTVERRADASSVIRKPALRPADLQSPSSSRADDQAWCDCGWPYTLLLPRGTAAGMPFRLLAMLSSGDDLAVPPQDHCTSISYCGLQDTDYPDRRAMGYPFDRPFATGIDATVAAHPNWFSLPVTIRHWA
ncbi:MAG: tyrosinase family protein [Acidimicrobiales bacterium]